MNIFSDVKIKHVTTFEGQFTDVWVNGRYSRVRGHLTQYAAYNEIKGVREIMKRKDK